MNTTARRLILTALTALAAGGALADQPGRLFGPLAELSAQERAQLRDRWQRLPAEEREAVRRDLNQRWPEMPPEARQQERRQLLDRLEERRDPRNQREQERYEQRDGYGQGYGTRPWDESNGRRGGRR